MSEHEPGRADATGLHIIVRSYRTWKFDNPRRAIAAIIALLATSETLWIIYVQETLDMLSYGELQLFAVIAALFLAENYYVNVLLRRRSGVELNPLWANLGRHVRFSYVYPIILIALLGVVYSFFQTFVLLLALACVLPLATFCTINDWLEHWEG